MKLQLPNALGLVALAVPFAVAAPHALDRDESSHNQAVIDQDTYSRPAALDNIRAAAKLASPAAAKARRPLQTLDYHEALFLTHCAANEDLPQSSWIMYYADSSDGWKAELPDTDGCRVALDEPFDYSTTPVPPHCEAGGKGIETKPIGDHGFQEVFATATWAGYNGKQKLECYRANDEDSFDGCTTYGYCWARKEPDPNEPDISESRALASNRAPLGSTRNGSFASRPAANDGLNVVVEVHVDA